MATCKECVGYNFCSRKRDGETDYYGKEIACGNVEDLCGDFKNKADVVLSPYCVGDKVYQLDTAGDIYESEITRIIYDTTSIAFDERAIGEIIFLTREQAEQKSRERG